MREDILPTHVMVAIRKLITEDFMLKGESLCYFHQDNKDSLIGHSCKDHYHAVFILAK